MLKKWGVSIDVLILFTVTYAPPRGQTHSMGLPPKDRGLSLLFFVLDTLSQHHSIPASVIRKLIAVLRNVISTGIAVQS